MAVPDVVWTPLLAASVLAGWPMKSVAPRTRAMAPRVSDAAWVPLLAKMMSEAPVPKVVEAKVWEVAEPAAAVMSRRPLPLPTLASSAEVSWSAVCGAAAPPMKRADEGEMRFVSTLRVVSAVAPVARKVKVKLRASVLTLLGEPPVTPGAPAMIVVAPV